MSEQSMNDLMRLPSPDGYEPFCDLATFRQTVLTLRQYLYERADRLLQQKLLVVSEAVINRQREVSKWEEKMLSRAKEQLYNQRPKIKARLASLRESIDGFTLMTRFPGLVSWLIF